MVQLLQVRLSSESNDEANITDVRWYNPANGTLGVATTAAMVQFYQNGGQAYICDGNRIMQVEVATVGGKSFLRLLRRNDNTVLSLTKLPPL